MIDRTEGGRGHPGRGAPRPAVCLEGPPGQRGRPAQHRAGAAQRPSSAPRPWHGRPRGPLSPPPPRPRPSLVLGGGGGGQQHGLGRFPGDGCVAGAAGPRPSCWALSPLTARGPRGRRPLSQTEGSTRSRTRRARFWSPHRHVTVSTLQRPARHHNSIKVRRTQSMFKKERGAVSAGLVLSAVGARTHCGGVRRGRLSPPGLALGRPDSGRGQGRGPSAASRGERAACPRRRPGALCIPWLAAASSL